MALRAGSAGRIGWVADGGVVIEPVNDRVLDGAELDVLIQVGPARSSTPRREEVVAFEVDELDKEAGWAWSVLVRGAAAVVDPQVASRAIPSDACPLVPEPGLTFVRLRTGMQPLGSQPELVAVSELREHPNCLGHSVGSWHETPRRTVSAGWAARAAEPR